MLMLRRLLLVTIPLFVGCGQDPGNARFQVRESVAQLHITHADPGAKLAVYDAAGQMIASGTADKLGSLLLRRLPPGEGYVVRVAGAEPPEYSRPLRVMSVAESQPPPSFYAEQRLQPGFNYIKTRDGTLLSAYVTLPGPPEDGPYPTIVSYSGYDPSRPGKPIEKFAGLCTQLPTLCDPPTDPSALFSSFFGYATVGVNMRGTGCSGGAYDYFEDLQVLDGYDIIETVAAQPFVLHGKVGMTGLSYPGISQLFVARARPPHLAAITPLSVIGNTASTLSPGGILNDGFALSWVTRVLDRAAPYGQGWERERVAAGDSTCAENQLLHDQRVDNVAEARATPFYVPERVDPLNPTVFAPRIEVPVFLAGAFQDEQTGPFFTTLLDRFTAAPVRRFTVYNGVHPDGFAPQVLSEWQMFLDLFVARRVPKVNPALRTLAPLLFGEVFGASLPLPPDRLAGHKTVEEAAAAYQAEPTLRAIFENGFGKPDDPGAPMGTFERSFAKWPPPAQPLRLYLHEGGALRAAPPSFDTASSFKLDPEAGQRVVLAKGGDVFDKLPKYDYRPLRQGYALAFLGEELKEDLVMLGTASADLWVRSNVDDADLQVSLTEVRPDGKEMYVQSGWLRASHRALASASTELWPEQTHLQKDAALLRPGEWVQARVAIAAFNHVFRKGSRIRVSVETPGDVRAAWRFQLKTFPGEAVHTIAHAVARPSSIVLPVLTGEKATTPLPACPSLRGQPCRKYEPLANTPVQ
jgi:hypothetical protein